jgi:hypothetical protein
MMLEKLDISMPKKFNFDPHLIPYRKINPNRRKTFLKNSELSKL